jgi:hypothetical protein
MSFASNRMLRSVRPGILVDGVNHQGIHSSLASLRLEKTYAPGLALVVHDRRCVRQFAVGTRSM